MEPRMRKSTAPTGSPGYAPCWGASPASANSAACVWWPIRRSHLAQLRSRRQAILHNPQASQIGSKVAVFQSDPIGIHPLIGSIRCCNELAANTEGVITALPNNENRVHLKSCQTARGCSFPWRLANARAGRLPIGRRLATGYQPAPPELCAGELRSGR